MADGKLSPVSVTTMITLDRLAGTDLPALTEALFPADDPGYQMSERSAGD